MENFRFIDEVQIPPRGEISVRLTFEEAHVRARFYNDGRVRIRPEKIGSPLLSRLARAVREDGTVFIPDCLSFLEELERPEDYDCPTVLVADEVYELTPIEPPAGLVLNFIFDGQKTLTPLMQYKDTLYSYDGRGIFAAENGSFFSLPEVCVIDAFLDRDRVLPAATFSAFFRITYPILEREERFRLYSSLHPVNEPPLKITPRLDEEGKLVCAMKWCVPYAEIHFFREAGMLAECSGELRPVIPALSMLPPVMQNDGEFHPDRMQYDFLLRLSRAMPSLFSGALPMTYPTPSPAPAPKKTETKAAEVPKQEEKKGTSRFLPYPTGAEVEIVPQPPVFNQRAVALERFLCSHRDDQCKNAKIVLFNAFSPDWSQMKNDQRKCYLYLRGCYLRGEKAPDAGYAYLLLLIYEAVNLPDRLEFLFTLWEQNRKKYPRLDSLMPPLVRDYIVLYQPDTPLTVIRQRVSFSIFNVSHPELYLDFESEEGIGALPFEELAVGFGYDLTKNKFYSLKTAPELNEAFARALITADRYHRKESGKGLFKSFRKKRVVYRTTACGSAVMTREHSAELTYRYSTTFYNPLMREEVILLMKCAENELRIRKGFPGRLRLTGLSRELIEAVREALKEKKEPVKVKINIREALSIEETSWNTTDKLIAAAGTGEEAAEEMPLEAPPAPALLREESAVPTEETGYEALVLSLGDTAREYLKRLAGGESEASLRAFAASKAVMPETLEEEINEKAEELTGDILIENGEIIEDYRAELPDLS